MELVNTDLIIKYTDKELSKTEKARFEESLQRNKLLRQELALHKHLNSFMKKRFKLEQDAEQDLFYDDADKFAKNAIGDYIVNEQTSLDIVEFAKQKSNFENEKKEFAHSQHLNDVELIAKKWVNQWNNISESSEENQKYISNVRSFVVKAMNLNENKKGKQKLLKLIGKKSNKRIIRLPFFNNWYYSAASVAALFLISFGLWKIIDKPMGNDELFVSFYQPYNLVSNHTRSLGELPEVYEEATNYYINENYREAALIFKKALDSNIEQVDIRFLYAISLVELKKYEEAVIEFKMVISKYDSYNLESKWYLSLCYLKLNKVEAAHKLLLELSEKRSFYQEPALEILDQLD